MKTSNPAFGPNAYPRTLAYRDIGSPMTIAGTINRTGILLLLTMASAAWVWNQFLTTRDPSAVAPYITVGAIGGIQGFIVALVTIFKQSWSPMTAPLYAVLEGLFLGAISSMLELRFPGISIEAVGLTFGTCICMLLAYRSGLIRPTQKFMIGIVAATGGIMVVYLVTMVLGFFHVNVPLIYGSGPIGILFSLVVVTVAALNLILDFNMIEEGARRGAPKYMEWYGAFGLLVTLVWLYLEMLRLLTKLRDSR